MTPLHFAAIYGAREVAELLIARRAPIDARNVHAATPLYLAAQAGHARVVDLLLARGADPTARAIDGSTPLEAATRGGHRDAARALERAAGRGGA
jgi:ankyrin repeat protein